MALEIVAPDGQLLIGQTFRGAASGHGALEATTRIRLNAGGKRIRTAGPSKMLAQTRRGSGFGAETHLACNRAFAMAQAPFGTIRHTG